MKVLPTSAFERTQLESLIGPYGLHLSAVADGATIPGSFWGAPEAGLIGDRLWIRTDTPVHSLLHEMCHYICMSPARRASLHTDAGGDHAEEDAVCFLQLSLADALPGYSRAALFADMDTWGYSFRLGSARRWFEEDAQDARGWLQREGLIDIAGILTARLRLSEDRRAA
jgi:hypothetical protein